VGLFLPRTFFGAGVTQILVVKRDQWGFALIR
jgi:hypothetical protein